MKKRISAFVCLCLIFSFAVALFYHYPPVVAEEQDASELLSDIVNSGEVVIEESALTSSVNSGLIMKVGSNYMLNKNSKAAIYNQDGFIYGSPVKHEGVVYVAIKPIATVFLGGNYGFASANYPSGSYSVSAAGVTSVITLGSTDAIVGGSRVTLSNEPFLAKGEDCDKEYTVISIDDVHKIFPSLYVTYDDMGLIGISTAENIFNRETDLADMVSLMKRFIYSIPAEDDFYNQLKENTDNFDHPYLIADEEKFTYLNNVYKEAKALEEKDPGKLGETIEKWLLYWADYSERLFERFTTLPDEPANPTYETKVNELLPTKYEHLVVEITNPFSGIKEGELYTDKWKNDENGNKVPAFEYAYQDSDGYYWPSKLHGDKNGQHYNDGYDWAGSRNSNGVSYAQYILDLALGFRITGERKYAELAYDIMLSLCDDTNWHNWSHKHFLSTGEMLYRLGLAYDWLYDVWSEIQNERSSEFNLNYITQKIYRKGIYYAYDISRYRITTDVWTRDATSYVNGKGTNIWNWSKCTINWNCVCNSGIVIGSMAIVGESGEGIDYTAGRDPSDKTNRVKWIMRENLSSVANYGLNQYAPDGSYIESPSYWSYATNYFSGLMWAVDTAVGDDLGFFETGGIDGTYYFAMHSEYQSTESGSSKGYIYWRYHDCGSGSQDTSMFLFAADMLNDPALAGTRLKHLKDGRGVTWSDILGYKPEYDELDLENLDLETDRIFESCEGVAARSDWESGALFVGLMGNKNNATDHGHVDSGSFIYANKNYSWFFDLGSDQYNAKDYLGHSYGAPRYNYYRNNAEGHNVVCLTSQQDTPGYINGQHYCFSKDIEIDGVKYYKCNCYCGGKLEKVVSEEDGMYAILDNAGAYGEFVNYARRGVLLTNSRQTTVIQDEISFKGVQSAVWIGHTSARISIEGSGRVAFLSTYLNGSKVTLRAAMISDNPNLRFQKIKAGIDEESFLLSHTNRPNYSTDRGGEPENSRAGYERLIIRAENVTEFNCAVVLEIVGRNREDSPLDYEYTEMANWTVSSRDYNYEDTLVLPTDYTEYINLLKTNGNLSLRYYEEEGALFGKRHSEFFKTLVNSRRATRQLPTAMYKEAGELNEPYNKYLRCSAIYSAVIEDLNPRIKMNSKVLNLKELD